MKKLNIIVITLMGLLVSVISFDTQAQQKVWSIGPEAGVSVSKYGMDANANQSKTGGVAGLFVTYSVVNNFAFTTKFLFYQKGASYSSSNTNQTLRYIEIPLIARYFLTKKGFFRPNVFAGPSFAFLMGANQNDRKVESYKDVYNRRDIGITGGAGFNFLIARETYFIIDARYTHGLTDLTKASGNVSNNSLALTAGFSFGI
ncbi:MAG TPA: porin family protein [Cyclobacteriaceae bacterium]|nr:porin family protein [Cyclobacteriaceae bacterium]